MAPGPVHGPQRPVVRVLKWSTSFSAGDTVVDVKLLYLPREGASAGEPGGSARVAQAGLLFCWWFFFT